MKKIVVTGADGFIGRNLLVQLDFNGYKDVETITRADDNESIVRKLQNARYVFHLAGVNRPKMNEEFDSGNFLFTKKLVDVLEKGASGYKLIFASSTQALLDNPYGTSKLKAEEVICNFIKNGQGIIYRLPGVFGKWSKPNYNTVVATFCHNLSRDLPISINDENAILKLVYVDDVISQFLGHLNDDISKCDVVRAEVKPVHEVTIGSLVEILKSFRQSRNNLFLPEVADPFIKALYSTWLTFLPEDSFSYKLELKEDNRGSLYELLKSPAIGQIFISTTLPGITRGNHFHHTKTEKFLVVQGEGLIRFRNILENKIIDYAVTGDLPEVVDIPPGYTHSITNTGKVPMITLFWANEVFDQNRTDTYFRNV